MGSSSDPQVTGGRVGGQFWLSRPGTERGGMLLSSGGQRPGTLPNTLQCTGEGRLPTERSPVDTGSRPARPAPAAGELRAERALEETAQASGEMRGLRGGGRAGLELELAGCWAEQRQQGCERARAQPRQGTGGGAACCAGRGQRPETGAAVEAGASAGRSGRQLLDAHVKRLSLGSRGQSWGSPGTWQPRGGAAE